MAHEMTGKESGQRRSENTGGHHGAQSLTVTEGPCDPGGTRDFSEFCCLGKKNPLTVQQQIHVTA